MARDFYSILGVDHKAKPGQIKKAYRKLAREFHPDVNPDDPTAEAKFKEIQQAYSVLSDPKQREIYDQVGHEAYTSGATAGPAGQQVDLGDIFGRAGGQPGAGGTYTYTVSGDASNVGNLFEQLFNQGFGGARSWQGSPFAGGARTQVRQKGADLQLAVSISFDEAYHGKELTLTVAKGEKLKVRIPPGIDSAGKVRLAGRGEPGLNGGPSGDLLLVITVQDHPYFKRNGDNICLDVPMTFSEAALGATIEVPTMTGKVQMKIPAGTQSGQEFRLRGKGFARKRGANRGDQIVKVQVSVPKQLDMRSRELLREYAELNPSNPRLGRWR